MSASETHDPTRRDFLYVATGMVKPAEVRQVWSHNWFHIGLMFYTAGMVIVTDFLTGVLTAIILYLVLFKFLDRPTAGHGEQAAKDAEQHAAPHEGNGQFDHEPVEADRVRSRGES